MKKQQTLHNNRVAMATDQAIAEQNLQFRMLFTKTVIV